MEYFESIENTAKIRHSLAAEKRSSIWQYIFSLLGLVIFTTLAVILGYIFFTRYYLTLKQRVTQWVTLILPEFYEIYDQQSLIRAEMIDGGDDEAALAAEDEVVYSLNIVTTKVLQINLEISIS